MQKQLFITVLAAMTLVVATAQTKKPPKPPTPPVQEMQDVPPPPPPPNAPPPPSVNDLQLPDDFNAFMKRNPGVKGIQWKNGDEIIIHLKSGKEERYNLNDAGSKKVIEEKYGELPQAPPPPPPPAPPTAPKPPRKHSTLS